MTWADEHRRCAESLGAYALGAVPEGEADQLRAHLARCEDCRAELASLEPAVRMIPGAVEQVAPSADLKRRLMATVTAEAELLAAAGSEADRAPAERRPRRRWFGLPAPAVLAVAATIVLGLVVATQLVDVGSGPHTRSIEAGVAPVAPRAKAWLRVRGEHMSLVVQDLPDPPADRVYQVWVKRPDRSAESADALFTVRSGTVEIPRRPHRGDRVMVTPEPHGGSVTPTASPIIDVTNA